MESIPAPAEQPPTTARRSLKENLLFIAQVLAVFISLGPVAVYVCSQLGRYFLVCELASHFQVQIFAGLAVTAVVLFTLRLRRVALCMALLAIYCSSAFLGIYFGGSQPAAAEKTVRMVAFNVMGSNDRFAEFISFARSSRAEILILTEYHDQWHANLTELHREFPYRIENPRWHGFGIAVFSKIPFLEEQTVQLTRRLTDVPAVIAKIAVNGRVVRLIGLHAMNPAVSGRLDLRNLQFQEVAELVVSEDVPTLVAGDFNCTPWSPFFRDFVRQTKLRDSRQGFGLQPSWPTTPWWLRIPIDHVLVSNEISIVDRRLGPDLGSDHYPVILEFSVAPPEAAAPAERP